MPKSEIVVLTLDQFGRQPWRKQPPVEVARVLLQKLDPLLARKMSRDALTAARRARSRRHYAYWTEVRAALGEVGGVALT